MTDGPEQTALTTAQIEQSVLYATDWTVETIAKQVDKGRMDLKPDFQRRDAWDDARKSLFIESLILGFPVPQIMLAETKDGFIVIDGKQRLLSIMQFMQFKGYSPLTLTGLEICHDLNGETYSKISSNPDHQTEISKFENQTIRTVIVRNWPNDEFLYQLFTRLNLGSLPLSPQELRSALYPGPFTSFVRDHDYQGAVLDIISRSDKQEKRMEDAELIVRAFAFMYFYPENYSGDLKGFLDLTCRELNKRSNDEFVEGLNRVEVAVSATNEIFGRNWRFSKWKGGENPGYTHRFTRTIFETVVLFFSHSQIAKAAISQKRDVEIAFRSLCEDEIFDRSISSNTNSKSAVEGRIRGFGQMLLAVLPQDVHAEIRRYVV